MSNRLIGLVAAFLIACCAALAQPLCKYTEYKSGKEMTQSRISGYVQDDNGILWLGTWNGLCRYDGQSYQLFRAAPGNDNPQSCNRIVKLKMDSESNLWCVTNNWRLYRFDIRTSQFTDVFAAINQPYFAEKIIQSIFPLHDKQVTWVVLRDGSCVRFNDLDFRDYTFIPLETAGKKQVVFQVHLDQAGNEWVLTNEGPIIYGKQVQSDYPFSRILELEGHTYLSSVDGYLAEYKSDGTLSFLTFPVTVRRIYDMKEISARQMALSTDAGLLIYDPKSNQFQAVQRSDDGRKIHGVTGVYEDARHRIWIFARDNGLYCLSADRQHTRWYESPRTAPARNERDGLRLIFEDAYGVVWVKPTQGYLSWYDEPTDRLCDFSESLPDDVAAPTFYYNDYFVDHQKNLWVSSMTLYHFTFQQRQFHFVPSGDPTEVRALAAADASHYWCGNKSGQLYLCSGIDSSRRYVTPTGALTTVPTSFVRSGVYAIYKDSRDIVWVGSKGDGLFRLSPQADGSFTVDQYKKSADSFSLSDNNVYAIYEDERQHLWIGTYGGGLNLVDHRFSDVRFININSKLKNYIGSCLEVRCITGTRHGQLLVGTTDGLITFSSVFRSAAEIVFYRQQKRPDDPYSLPGNDVMQVLCNNRGKVFVCTYGLGISELVSDTLLSDTLKFRTYLNHENPNGDVTFSAKDDSHGRIWTVTPSGISCFNPDSHNYTFFNYTDFDRDFVFTEAMPLISPTGEFYAGAVGGVVHFKADSIKKDHFSPHLVFTSIRYSGNSTPVSCNDIESLTLPLQKRSVSISFAALDMHPSPLLRYAYKLNEVDDDWTYTGTPEVNYVNLPSGDFKLMIRSTNHDGVWCDNMRTLTIHVTPTFWETPWSWLVYLLLFLLLMTLVIYIYMYIYKLRHKMDMEHKMAGMKLSFFTDISHELRTPLTLISGPLNDVLSQEPLSLQARNHLELAQKNTTRMLELVNQILDFRKIQTRHVRLSLHEQDVIPLLSHIMAYFNDMATENHIDYTLQTSLKTLPLWLDADKFEKIIFNLLSNAFKYTDSGKAITVSLEDGTEAVKITVADEGRGIESSRLGNIFDRFVSLSDGSDMQPSSGIGLSLVKELVQLHHAHISVSSELGRGTRFTLLFNKKRSAYQTDAQVDFIADDKPSQPSQPVQEGKAQIVPDPAPVVATAEAPVTTKQTRKMTILVVEDNADLRQFIVSILHQEYNIREAENGKQGLDIVKQDDVDFILTDIMMPVMDGMEMVRRIKSDPLVCHIPIVVLSAKSSIDDRIEGLENGIDDYLTKPFSSTYLRSRIANLIHQRQLLQQSFMASCLHEVGSPAAPEENNRAFIELQAPQVLDYDKEFISRVMAYFEEHMSNVNLSVEDFADALNMSRTSFYRKVKSVIGLSPVDFIRQIRIKRAVQYINAGEDSLSQIAYKVGFSDPKYFSKCFKRDMGMPPLEYKQKVQQSKSDTAS